MDGLIQQNSLLISLLAGNSVQRPVRNGLHRQPGSRVSVARLSRSWALRASAAGIGVFVNLHFHYAAKYVTETNQPAIFIILEVSQKWYDSLPKDLQQIVDRDGLSESLAINVMQEDSKQNGRRTKEGRNMTKCLTLKS
jgi:hypothetical protein